MADKNKEIWANTDLGLKSLSGNFFNDWRGKQTTKDKMEGSTPERKMDSWYSWVVCAALFFIEFIVMGLYTSFGTLFVALIEEFNASESSAGIVTSFNFI